MSEAIIDRVAELLEGGPSREEERALVDLLASAEAATLNRVLEALDVRQLLDSLNNHLFGPKMHDELFHLLTVHRAGDLSIRAQAAVAAALQQGRTDARDQHALRDLLLSRGGEELTKLKNAINLTRGRHDLEGLVFFDVGDDEVREEILEHFLGEATWGGLRELKVLSDIDDTALARIHETRYPKGTVIPGVLAFYEALDIGPHDQPSSRGDLTFVTARPSDGWGLMKGQSRRTLGGAGIADLSIMTGSWFNLLTRDSMAAKKVRNIAHYARLFPEYDLVFVGDSGQGDVSVAQQILDEHPDVVRGCFIHDVVEMPQEKRRELAEQNIWVVDTYVGAAVKAHELGLISEAGLRSVVDETLTDLDEVEWESPEQEAAARRLVERDVVTATG